MKIQHAMLITTADIQLASRLASIRPSYEWIDDFWPQPIDAYELQRQAPATLSDPYCLEKSSLNEIFSRVYLPDDLRKGHAINRICVVSEEIIGSRAFFECFGYQKTETDSAITSNLFIVEFETASMQPDIFQLAESLHLSQYDTDVWHFYVSPSPQGFGFYNTVEKMMYVLDREKVLQQIAHPNEPEHQVYNLHLIEMLDKIFELAWDMEQHEIQKQRVANQKPKSSPFSLYHTMP